MQAIFNRKPQRSLLLLLAVLFLLGATANLARGGDYETREVEFFVKSGQTLELDLDAGGSLRVEAWDKNDKARVEYYERDDRLDAFDIEMDQDRGGLRISADANRKIRSCSLHFHVWVPEKFDVDFRSAGGGLELIGLEGEFTGRTGGGELSFENAKGEARMTSGGGTITVRDCELDGKLSTGGGRVLMRNVTGDLQATSGGGNVKYENVRGKDGELRSPLSQDARYITAESVLIKTAGGAIEVDAAPEGACVQTGGGDIQVLEADRFVNATTGGGDIRIEVARGWVKAQTGAGDIDVELAEGGGEGEEGIYLISGLGDITVVLPRDFSMDLDVDLGFTKNSRQDYRIISDFEFKEKRTEDWDYDNGSPKKHVYGTATIDGGEHLVVIRTTNGNVHIKAGR